MSFTMESIPTVRTALPGAVLTVGIDSMVKLIHLLRLGDTASAAKTAEQTIAIVVFLVAGIVAGVLFFAVVRAWRARSYPTGLVMGAVAGALTLLIIKGLA